MRVALFTERAPRPTGPYNQAVCVDGWLFISGQIPIDPATSVIVGESFEKQVERVLENMKAIIEAAGGSLRDVVKTTVFLKDIKKFGAFNEVYARYFSEDPPARSVIEVSDLPRGVEIEVEAIAKLKACP
uniref:RidA family protein n=1 Tax=Fervidicoccus fontis TaxID=683846 RepID=A0A7C1I2A0_9CREN